MLSFFENLTPTSINFFIFVIIALGLYYLAPRYQTAILFIFSLIFCLSWKWTFAFVLFIFSLINYFFSLQVSGTEDRKRLLWLWAGIILNAFGLTIYKLFDHYSSFFNRALVHFNLNNELFENFILMPVGISFYSLQAISYLIDIYRRQIPVNKNFLEVSLFFSYFPKLLAGPIERAESFFEQLKSHQIIDNKQIQENLLRILVGLCRKLIISEAILQKVPTNLFSKVNNYPTAVIYFWWLAYVFVIYNDFAGYTSIVRGISGLFGIRLSQNFEQPLFSANIIDFWNRWHMSLSNWLRDYIYLPVSRFMLRRNPNGKYLPNLIVPPIITMLVSGFWHGLAPNFILWGFINGALQAIERIKRAYSKKIKKPSKLRGGSTAVLSMLFIIILSIPFKFDIAQSLNSWIKLFDWSNSTELFSVTIIKPLLACSLSIFIDLIEARKKDETGFLTLGENTKIFLLALAIILLFMSTRQQIPAAFIYQEF